VCGGREHIGVGGGGIGVGEGVDRGVWGDGRVEVWREGV
jgi:hypothetical protein